MSAGRRYVPPAPGMMASRVSGSATVVVLAKMRKCVVRASSRPPPNAGAASADIVGMGSCEIEVRVPRRVVRKFAVLGIHSVRILQRRLVQTHSSCVKVARSFKSAPAQKLVSMSLAKINARVEPFSPSLCMLLTWWCSSESNCRDIALRAAGRLRDKIRMLPECGAGTFVTLRAGVGALEYAHRCTGRINSRVLDRSRRGIFACMGVAFCWSKEQESFEVRDCT
jgi:hypothetical protein